MLAAFIDAHERGDTSAAISLVTKDIRITMPPLPQCYLGRDAIAPLLANGLDRAATGEWRLVPAWANRQPAAVSYLRRPGDSLFRAFKIDVLQVRSGLIAEITTFSLDVLDALGVPHVLSSEVPQ